MRQRRWFESEAWILAPAVVLVAVIPAKAGIHFLFSLVANLSDQSWITRRIRGSPFGPFAARMFASASCLRSPAFAGMTS
jgi:hypothetical protein